MSNFQKRTWALLAAAGQSSRMGIAADGRSKVLLEAGPEARPFLFYTIKNFMISGAIEGISIATRPEDAAEIESVLLAAAPNLEYRIVDGAATRQGSVAAALSAVPPEIEFVAVHDAARPFCSATIIVDVISQAHATGAAMVAIPVKATLKNVIAGKVLGTIDRSTIWEAQTPQVFRSDLLRAAHRNAASDGHLGTDESELVERLGHQVSIVTGSELNFKITTAQDLSFAEWLLVRAQ